MKRALITATALCLALTAQAAEMTGPEIVRKMNDLMNQDSVRGKMKMTIQTSSGGERTFLYETFAKDRGEKNLMRYLEPSRVKGDAILMTNNADDIWAYFQRTNRVRKLATHAKKRKLEGSDFSYEDMGSGDAFIDDFESVLKGREELDGQECYKVEMTKKEGSELSYSRLVMWVRTDNFVAVKIDYYHEDDPKYRLKTMLMSDIRVIDGIPTAMKMVMKNQEDDTQTAMEMIEVEFGPELDDSLFTERGLKASR